MNTFKFLLTALSLFLVLQSCDSEQAEKDLRDDLVGIWNLESITGGFAGTGYQADFTDVEFKSNGTYRINNHDEAKGDGNYILDTIEGKIILRLISSDATKITFENEEKTVTFDRGKLILSDPCCDLYQYTFGKESN